MRQKLKALDHNPTTNQPWRYTRLGLTTAAVSITLTRLAPGLTPTELAIYTSLVAPLAEVAYRHLIKTVGATTPPDDTP